MGNTFAEPAADPTPVEPAEPAWTGPSQDEWGSVLGYIQSQQQAQEAWEQQQAAQYAQQQQAPPQFDLFSDDASTQLGSFIQQQIAQAMQPYSSWQQEQQYAEAEERALDILEDIVSRQGEFMAQDETFQLARSLANAFLPEETERHGWGPKAGEAALQRAADFLREYQSAVGTAYHERQINQLTRIGEAGREPSGATSGVQQGPRTPPGGDELSVVTQFGGFPGRPF